MTTFKKSTQLVMGGLPSLVLTGVAMAQSDSTTSSHSSSNTAQTTTSESTVWYGNGWVWAAGIAVFLVVIIALTNRGKSSNA